MGYMATFGGWIDVHGAGAQRSDPKTGDPTKFPTGFGPQGDAIRIYNYVRLVRDAKSTTSSATIKSNLNTVKVFPNPVTDKLYIQGETDISKIEISDITGSIILTKFPDTRSASINMTSYLNGIYFVKIFQENSKNIVVKKIVK